MIELIHLAVVDSTQAFLKRHPELGTCAVLADAQTAGRGRGDNRWESAPGAGLWLSVALPPPPLEPGIILRRAMEALIGLLDPSGRVLGLKWPNDLVARREGGLVKLGGILGEQGGERTLLGVGVNLAAAPALDARAIPAACLADLGLPVPDRRALALALAEAWLDLAGTRPGPPPAFLWPAPGESLRWEEGQGTCVGWEADGRLVVQAGERTLRLASGDVRSLAP